MKKALNKKNFYINRALSKLTIGFCGKFGKNFYGRITVYHKSSSFLKKYRIIDYKRILYSEGCLFTLEKRPSHTGFLGLIFYFIGMFSYIIVPNLMEVGDHYKGFTWKHFKKENHSCLLSKISTGIWLNNIELVPGKGSAISRAAGCSSYIYSKWKDYVFLKVSSGRILKISKFGICVLGVVSNKDHKLEKKKKSRCKSFIR